VIPVLFHNVHVITVVALWNWRCITVYVSGLLHAKSAIPVKIGRLSCLSDSTDGLQN